MILFVHMLFGSAVAKLIHISFWAVLLAYFSHYCLDFFPHIEYPVKNIKNKIFRKSAPDISFVALDFTAGISMVYFLSKGDALLICAALASIIPDFLSLLNGVFKNSFLQAHSRLHQGKLHYFSHKEKIPVFWRFLTQITAVAVSLLMLSL